MQDSGNSVAVRNSHTETAEISFPARFEQLKALLQKELGETAYRSWIAPVEPLRLANGIMELAVPTRFIRDWVRTHYADRIRLLWGQNFSPVARIDFVISLTPSKPAAIAQVYEAGVAPANQNASTPAKPAEDSLSSPLDPRYTLDNFVTGAPNALAAAAARRVSEGGTVSFNPLYIHGGVGLGKTHLMQAAASKLRASARDLRVVYMSAEKFMYQFVRALRAKETMAFKSALRGIDVLMIDDLQFICGKESTQEEFFHTFNALMDEGKQIVLTADRTPAELDGIDHRLRSRLGGGLTVQVLPPTPEMRQEILQTKCVMMKRDIAPEVLSLLAGKITSSVRELEGALNRLIAHAEMAGRAVTLEIAEDLLHDLLRTGTRKVSIEEIQRKVAEHYNIRFSDMLSPRRARPVARPRQVAMYLAKALTDHSLPEIGRKFGGRDHTTIIHGVRKVEELLAADQNFRNDVETLKKALAA